MKRPLLTSLSLLLVSIASSAPAFAQGPTGEAPLPQLPSSAPPSPPPPAAVVEEKGPQPEVRINPNCVLVAYEGFARADAATAARIVCGDLQREGSTGAVSVYLSRLGTKVVLGVSDANGANERRFMLSGIEEVSVASPRLAKAYVHRSSEDDTVNIDNVVGDEARIRKNKPGTVHLGLGVVGAMPLGGSSGAGGGLSIAPVYDSASRVSFGIDFRLATQDEFTEVNAGAFARYYFLPDSVSPYAGGGLAWGYMKLKRDDGTFSGSNSGLAPFGEVGVELARTSRSRFNIGLRIEVPTYSLDGRDNTITTAPSLAVPSAQKSVYVVPLSLAATVLF